SSASTAHPAIFASAGSARVGANSLQKFPKQNRSVRPTEPKRVGKGDIDFALFRGVWRVVQIALGIRKFIVSRWRNQIMVHRQNRVYRFNPASRAETMPGNAFG